MTSSAAPVPYEMWRLEFEHEDQPGVIKARPVVVGALYRYAEQRGLQVA